MDVDGTRLKQLCLTAAAVDDYCLGYDLDYRDTALQAERVSVLASRKDRVLRYAYPAGDLLQALCFFWTDTAGLALGYHGPGNEQDQRCNQ